MFVTATLQSVLRKILDRKEGRSFYQLAQCFCKCDYLGLEQHSAQCHTLFVTVLEALVQAPFKCGSLGDQVMYYCILNFIFDFCVCILLLLFYMF